jgi:hypothetical protein
MTKRSMLAIRRKAATTGVAPKILILLHKGPNGFVSPIAN